jgi:hypothetical protein
MDVWRSWAVMELTGRLEQPSQVPVDPACGIQATIS